MKNNTCVYIHTRLDGIVFYVGIGNPTRPYEETGRNRHWHRLTKKYGGYSISILHQNLSWEAACALEVELIKKYREVSGTTLCNMTLGGEGTKGNQVWLGKTHSTETRAKMSDFNKGKTLSLETRAKISSAKKGKSLSEEHRVKISESQKGRVFSEEHRKKLGEVGRNRSPESRAKTAEANRNMSPEARAKMSEAAKNRSPETRAKMSEWQKGKVFSEETRAKISAAQKARFSKMVVPMTAKGIL